MAAKRALLMIADIGGYTRFMTVHRINLSHAQYVVAELLEAIIDAAAPKLELAKIEGDAAFFYAILPASGPDQLAAVSQAVSDIHRGFLQRRYELEIDRLCSCDGCVQASQLKLKFVAHSGEVAFQRIKRFTELAGVDVIFVHRLLKNSVPVSQYVLASETVYQRMPEELRRFGHATEEDLEGIGRVPLWYVDLDAIEAQAPTPRAPSFFRQLWAWLKMTLRSLPYFVGAREPCKAFRNMDEIGPPSQSA